MLLPFNRMSMLPSLLRSPFNWIPQPAPCGPLQPLQIVQAALRLWLVVLSCFQHFHGQIACGHLLARHSHGFPAFPLPVLGMTVRHRERRAVGMSYWRGAEPLPLRLKIIDVELVTARSLARIDENLVLGRAGTDDIGQPGQFQDRAVNTLAEPGYLSAAPPSMYVPSTPMPFAATTVV